MGKKTAGILICLGVAAAATVLVPRLSKLRGPADSASRAATRTGLMLYGKSREVLAEMGEIVDDLVAEVEAGVAAATAADMGAADSTASEKTAAAGASAAGSGDTGDVNAAKGEAAASAEESAETVAETSAPRSAA